MKANELRIGNYLEFEGKPMSVSSIHNDNTIRFNLTNGDSIGCYKMHKEVTKPIPLTEDWLVKFRFQRTKEDYVEYRLGEYYVRQFQKNNGEFDLAYDCGEHYLFHITTFIFVHQLQNLYFALTGEELKIERNEKPM